MYADTKVILFLLCISAHIGYVGAEYYDEDDDAYIPRYIMKNLEQAFEEGTATAAKMLLSDKLDEWKEFQINIGVTGNSGVGKSSFINALRGLTADDDDAAAVGVVETTIKSKSYKHPNNDNLLLWELPCVGTPSFLRDEYLDKIEFQYYDYFIIISSGRFTENDSWLARELKKRNKKFYFARSKISQDVENDRKSHPKSHNRGKVLDTIRNDCKKNLQRYASDIYLVDNYEPDEYDFNNLTYKLIIDAPELKREAMLFTLNRMTKDIILAKKEALMERIHYVAMASGVVGAIPLPFLDVAADLSVRIEEGSFYQQQFGLTDEALKRYAERMGTSAEELISSLGLKIQMVQFTMKDIAPYMAKIGAKKANWYILNGVLTGIGVDEEISLSFLDVAADLLELIEEGSFYKQQVGLTDEALKRYAERMGTSAEELISSLGLKIQRVQFTMKGIAAYIAKIGANKATRYTSKYVLPGIGSIIGATASYTTCYHTLEDLLELTVHDALKIADHINTDY